MPGYDAIVLAGGRSSRLGRDKAMAVVGGRRLLARALDAVQTADRVVVVGAPRPLRVGPTVSWTAEEPPFGGPAAGLAHGLRWLARDRGPSVDRVVVVLAVDVPFAGVAVPRLIETVRGDPSVDAAMLRDPDGVPQPLIAAYRAHVLLERLGDADWRNRPIREVVAKLSVVRLVAPGDPGDGNGPPVPIGLGAADPGERRRSGADWRYVVLDCDTPEQLRAAQRWAARYERPHGSAARLQRPQRGTDDRGDSS
ncbi:MAG: NTP transferase domain-containing protein [Acidothermus cellulolyticus]|nr:NTP transferase domain-containing protein [Acidothermus cellulolyticus]